MRRRITALVGAALLFALVAAGCGETSEQVESPASTEPSPTFESPDSSSPPPEPSPSSTISTRVDLTLKASRSDDDISFSGTTNLPDGAVLFYSALEVDGAWCSDDGKATVKNGKYSGAIKDMYCDWLEGEPYVPAGDIELWVGFQVSSGNIPQPPELLDVFGEWGGKMEGDCVMDLPDVDGAACRRAERIVIVKP